MEDLARHQSVRFQLAKLLHQHLLADAFNHALVAEGDTLAPSAESAIRSSRWVVMCVYDYATARAIWALPGVSEAIDGRTLVHLSTGSPEDARNALVWAVQHGARHLDGAIQAAPSQMGQDDTPLNAISPSFGAFFQHEAAVIGSGDYRITESPLRISIEATQRILDTSRAAGINTRGACLVHRSPATRRPRRAGERGTGRADQGAAVVVAMAGRQTKKPTHSIRSLGSRIARAMASRVVWLLGAAALTGPT